MLHLYQLDNTCFFYGTNPENRTKELYKSQSPFEFWTKMDLTFEDGIWTTEGNCRFRIELSDDASILSLHMFEKNTPSLFLKSPGIIAFPQAANKDNALARNGFQRWQESKKPKGKMPLEAVSTKAKTLSHFPDSYRELFNNSPDKLSAARALLNDYTKGGDGFWGFVGRVFTGHWNRHHIDQVSRIVDLIDNGKIQSESRLLLRLTYLQDKLVNPEGSLAHRIAFIIKEFKGASPDKRIVDAAVNKP